MGGVGSAVIRVDVVQVAGYAGKQFGCFRGKMSVVRRLWALVCRVLVMLCPPILLRGAVRLREFVGMKRAEHQLRAARRLHLGCGRNAIAGWSNLDFVKSPNVVSVDLTQRIPVTSGSIELIFCEHFIEHISEADGERFLAECHRLLQPGGTLRISTPDLRKLIEVYLAGNITEWSDLGWSPATPCALLNEGVRSWGHLFMYDEQQLMAALQKTGFVGLRRVAWRTSEIPGLSGLECRPFHGDLIVEATRPR
jgi:predicted SAM-dependent methyltransferase